MNGNLKNTIKKIIDDIDNPAHKIEQNVRSGIVYAILDELGWNSKNKKEVFDESSVIKNDDNKDQKTRVDIALLDENNKLQNDPLVFMELKAIDKLKKYEGEKQLFGYTNHMRPLISILTNGKQWYFYNNLTTGKFADSLFLTLNLCENNIDKVVDYLTLFLHKDNYNFAEPDKSKCLEKIKEIKAKESKLSEIKKYLEQHLENTKFNEADWQEIKNYCVIKLEQNPIKKYSGKRKLLKRGGEISGTIFINGNNEYVLLKGAIFAKTNSKHLTMKEAIEKREQCIKNIGSDCEVNDEFTYKLNKELTFKSASAAASFIVAGSVDGKIFFNLQNINNNI